MQNEMSDIMDAFAEQFEFLAKEFGVTVVSETFPPHVVPGAGANVIHLLGQRDAAPPSAALQEDEPIFGDANSSGEELPMIDAK
jgi:hypothetical protein